MRRGCMIFVWKSCIIEKKSLHDFFCVEKCVIKKEVTRFFCGAINFFRGCVIFFVEMLFNVQKIQKFCDEKNVKIICDKKGKNRVKRNCDKKSFVTKINLCKKNYDKEN